MSDPLDALITTAGQVADDVGGAVTNAAEGAAEDAANATNTAGHAIADATGGAVDFGARAGGGHVGVDAELFGHGAGVDVGAPGAPAAQTGVDTGVFRSGPGDTGHDRDGDRGHDTSAARGHDTDFGRGAPAASPHPASADHAFGAGVTSVGAHQSALGHIEVAHPSGGDIRSAVDPAHFAPHLVHDPVPGGVHDPLDHGAAPGGVHDPFGHDAGLGASHEPGLPGVHDPIGHDSGPAHDPADHHGF
jgi:hypothetical protein